MNTSVEHIVIFDGWDHWEPPKVWTKEALQREVSEGAAALRDMFERDPDYTAKITGVTKITMSVKVEHAPIEGD